ncbi:hypothetical protein CPB84DRAFT_1760500 [Gymnopilus junonius]|uniref:Uncharacterized protein n=1 Tax=Gymnopilus junonius TaxID=109634 RepID=A0A9P5P1B0_GYMJU|nr:hypothetical protein CPB84DRAFT_1760500 [Gymnopilus junonius]
MSLPAQPKPPLKRRKLHRSRTPSPPSSKVSLLASAASTPAAPKENVTGAIPVCASCHRAIPTGSTIQCAICSSTTCTVCSRTCTHSASSHPSTPLLTWSPSPSPSLTGSPRRSRSVLSLVNLSNANDSLTLPSPVDLPPLNTLPIVGKRRKVVDEDDRPDALTMVCGGAMKDGLLFSAGDVVDHRYSSQDEFGPGCRRQVCRRCCYEDVPSNTTTCMDCYGSLICP